MNITLKIGGEDKSFTADFISARMVRKTIEIGKTTNFNDLSPEELDRLVDFIVDLFGKQFTRDEMYDGLAARDLMATLERCLSGVVVRLSAATGDPKNE